MKTSRLLLVFGAGFLFACVFGLAQPAKALAETFTVNYTGDDSDGSPGDGFCDAGEGACSLRAAIEEANALSGADTIEFDIAGDGVQTITPASDYPTIIQALTIDGTSQPGASCGTLVPTVMPAGSNTRHTLLIEIDGTNANDVLSIGSNTVTIQGLVINRYSEVGITTGANSDLNLNCNYIGTNASGAADVTPDSTTGINSDMVIGTIQNNLISGNSTGINNGNAAGVTIQRNLIGTTANGMSALGNSNGIISNGSTSIGGNIVSGNEANGISTNGSGISVTGNFIGLDLAGFPVGNGQNGFFADSQSSNYTLGGPFAGERNVISGNGQNGIKIYNNDGPGCSNRNINSTITGNYIGTDSDGIVGDGYGNQGSGIEVNEQVETSCIFSVYQHQIGGTSSSEANTIAGNTEDGVRVFQASSDRATDVFSISILRNSIYGNGGLGINLATDADDDGVADTDLGQNAQNNFKLTYPAVHANNYINSPIINSAELSGNKVSVNYDLTAPSVEDSGSELQASDLVGFRLDFYINGGKDHLGSFIVDGSETNASHTFTTNLDITDSTEVTATTTAIWQNLERDDPCNFGQRYGVGPPYAVSSGCGG